MLCLEFLGQDLDKVEAPGPETSRSGRPRLGNNREILPPARIATIGLTGRRANAKAPPAKCLWGQGNWLRGKDLNLRPSGYEGGSTQPADGRRPSCFQSSR